MPGAAVGYTWWMFGFPSRETSTFEVAIFRRVIPGRSMILFGGRKVVEVKIERGKGDHGDPSKKRASYDNVSINILERHGVDSCWKRGGRSATLALTEFYIAKEGRMAEKGRGHVKNS